MRAIRDQGHLAGSLLRLGWAGQRLDQGLMGKRSQRRLSLVLSILTGLRSPVPVLMYFAAQVTFDF